MPRQSTTKRNAEGSHYGSEAMPTKKLQKASPQLVLNSPPRLTSAADSPLSESPLPPSLTSDSSIEDSSSSTANSLADKSSSAPSTTGACSTSVLQEARPNRGGASLKELYAMSLEELKEYGRSRGWKVPPKYDSIPGGCDPDIDYESDSDYHPDIDYAYGLGEFGYVGEFGDVGDSSGERLVGC